MGKLQENQKLLKFLRSALVSTLAVPIDQKGTIHIAAMRCFVTTNPLRVYYVTSRGSEKCALLKQDSEISAACDIGGHIEPEMYVQMRGFVRMFEFSDRPDIVSSYFAHRGSSQDKEGDSSVLLEFEPTYAKYTDYAEGWQKHLLDLS